MFRRYTMKLKKLMKLYNGDFLQLKDSKNGVTSRAMNQCDIYHNYYDNLERKVLYFEITKRCESNEPVLWVEIL